MNKIVGFVAIAVTMLSIGCQTEEFQVSEDGYQYKYIVKGEGEIPKDGEFVRYNIKQMNEKDSVFFETTPDQPAVIPCNTAQWEEAGPLFKALQTIKEGDSVLIKIPTKSLFEGSPQGVPPFLNPEGDVTFCIGASKIMTQEEMQAEAEEASEKQFEVDVEIIEAYLAENNIEAQSTDSGLRYVIDSEGSGTNPAPGDSVSVHYTGTLLDGTKFDSSVDRDEPFDFVIGRGQVIRGWDEGIALLKPGSKGTLYIPSALAYGNRAAGSDIKPNSVLKFDVELLDVKEN